MDAFSKTVVNPGDGIRVRLSFPGVSLVTPVLMLLSIMLMLTACSQEKEEGAAPVLGEDEMLVSLAELTQRDMDNILSLPDKALDFGIAATTVYFCNSPDPLNVDTGNGSVTYTNNDVDPPGRSTGDNVETVYANCTHSVLLAGEVVIDGSINYRVNDLTGTPFQASAWNIDTTASANLTVSTPVISRTTTSTSNLQYGSADGLIITRAIKGDASYAQSIGAVQSETTRLYDALYAVDTVNQTYETGFDVSKANTNMGSKQYTTTPSFSGTVGQAPEAGAMNITAVNAATGVTTITAITALGGGNVQVDTDSNGDGVIDLTEQTTWADIGRLWRVI